jgi:hypothetical protein
MEVAQGTYCETNQPYQELLSGHVIGLAPERGGLGAAFPLQSLAQKTVAGQIPFHDYFDLYHLVLGINFTRGLVGATAQLVGSEQVYHHVSLAGDEAHGPIAQCALSITSPISSWAGINPYWWEIFEAGGLFLGDQGQIWSIEGDQLTVWTDNLSHWGRTIRHRQQSHFALPEEECLGLEVVGDVPESVVIEAQRRGHQLVSLTTTPVVSEHYTTPIDMWLHAGHDAVYHGCTKARLGKTRLNEVLTLGHAVLRQKEAPAIPLLKRLAMNIREAAHIYDRARGRTVVYVVNSAVMGMSLLYLSVLLDPDSHQQRLGRVWLLRAAMTLTSWGDLPTDVLHSVSKIAKGEGDPACSYGAETEPLQLFPLLEQAGLPVTIPWA